MNTNSTIIIRKYISNIIYIYVYLIDSKYYIFVDIFCDTELAHGRAETNSKISSKVYKIIFTFEGIYDL